MSAKQQRHKGSKTKQRKASFSTSPNPNREPKISFQQRINPVYLKEESQVQKLIEPRQEKLLENTQTDLEIQFFTECVKSAANTAQPEHDGTDSSPRSLQSAELRSGQPQFLDSIVQIDEDKLFERVKETLPLDPTLLYHPSTDRPTVPSVASDDCPTLASQGVHEPPLNARINERNKNILYNRLLEEGKDHLFNRHGELMGLQEEPHRDQHQLMRFESAKEFPVKFVLVQEEELLRTDQLEDSRVLVIRLGRLKFHHHHLFSEEEFLVKSIERAYHDFSTARRSAASEKVLQRILFQKNAAAELNKDSAEYRNTLVEILEMRGQFHMQRKAHNDRIQQILHDYKTLRSLRKTQLFNSTTLKLIISVDESLSKNHGRFLEDFLAAEVEESFELESLEYQEVKRDRKRRKSLGPEEGEGLPAVPPKPSLEKVKSKLRKKYKDCHFDLEGHSGVDILMGDTPRTRPLNCLVEKKRIGSISGLKYHLKLYCNNEAVGLISSNAMSEDFEIHCNASLSLRLADRLPHQLRIDLVEQRPLKGKMKLSKISVPVPRFHQQANIDACNYSHLEFVSPKSVQSELGIGSGQFCIRKNHQQFISGTLAVKIGWKECTIGTELPIQRIPRIMSQDPQFDPMNPDADCPLPTHSKTTHSGEDKDEEEGQEEEEEFHFNEDELAFCSMEEFRNNPRNRILAQRAKNHLRYRDYKLVPFNPRQIEETEEDTERHTKILDETLGMDPIDLQRFKGKKYLSDVYSKISNYCRSLSEECDEDHLLMENMPTLASLVTRFFELFGPNRPLKPARRPPGASHRLSSRNIEVSQFRVSLNIVRAFGVPQRQDESQLSARKSSNMSSPKDSGYRPVNIRPFVTASFQDQVAVRTSTGDGSNPTWNEQMLIPLNLKNWSDMKGYVNIQLFDEYVDDILEDDRNRLTDIYQRISSRFIAELRIPLTDLYFSQRIEGTFEMNSPLLLGYSKSTIKTPQSQQGATTAIMPDLKGPVYISLLLNLEPFFEHDFFTTKHLECTESDQVKATIGVWMYDFLNEFPFRKQDPFVTLLNGKRVCIVNLLGPIELPFPAPTEDKEKVASQLMRYVSLIPVLQTIDPCVELSGVWLANEVFNTLRCSSKDLAVLLTNFYLSLGISVWLMVGESQLRVNSCFVLVKESDAEYFIIDPVVGKKYAHTDTYCPLTSVHFLVNDQNIWGNVQVERKAFMTRYDVKDSSDWRPAFKKPQVTSRGHRLRDTTYNFQQSYDIRNIHSTIESKLAKKIGQWRGHRKTAWNRIVKDNLRRILVELERDAGDDSGDNGDHLEKLNFLHNNYKISGCPLNMSYINLSHVVERVKALGIHLNTDPRVEFGLSVYVHPYPNFVISVWVFLIALLPK